MYILQSPVRSLCEEKKGGSTVEVPDLPGCVSEGDSLADAILMATDAACGWVLDELEDGKPLYLSQKLTAGIIFIF